MSSSASDLIALCAVVLALPACARPAPIERPVTNAFECAAGSDVTVRSVSIEVWRTPVDGTACALCRAGDPSCELVARECVDLGGDRTVEEAGAALAGRTIGGAHGSICVVLLGLRGDACALGDCGATAASCVDEVGYCGAGFSASEGTVVVGLGVEGSASACVPLSPGLVPAAFERCLGGSTPREDGGVEDAGRRDADLPPLDAGGRDADLPPLDGARPPRDAPDDDAADVTLDAREAGPFSPRDASVDGPPFDARLLPRDGGARPDA